MKLFSFLFKKKTFYLNKVILTSNDVKMMRVYLYK